MESGDKPYIVKSVPRFKGYLKALRKLMEEEEPIIQNLKGKKSVSGLPYR